MTLAYMRYGKAVGTPSMITVHNLAFQGRFGAGIFGELGLPASAMALDGVEYYGGVGFLKAGLQAAWAITTVSPTYAQEIRSPEFGMGLDGLVNMRSVDLYGIVNGIDTEIWDPATDKHLVSNYTAKTLKARHPNRTAVEDRFDLDRDDSPIVCVISRLTWQKGMDILAAVVDGIVARVRAWRFWDPATPASKVRCWPPPPATAVASASSSVMTRAFPTPCRAAVTPSSSRRASSLAD